jgi:hypothetical protein
MKQQGEATRMSAWQAYKVMLLGLAVPTAAVIVEIGHGLFDSNGPVSATEETTTFTSVRLDPPPVVVLPAATPSPAPVAERPAVDEPSATANAPNDRGSQEADGVETAPPDADDSH